MYKRQENSSYIAFRKLRASQVHEPGKRITSVLGVSRFAFPSRSFLLPRLLESLLGGRRCFPRTWIGLGELDRLRSFFFFLLFSFLESLRRLDSFLLLGCSAGKTQLLSTRLDFLVCSWRERRDSAGGPGEFESSARRWLLVAAAIRLASPQLCPARFKLPSEALFIPPCMLRHGSFTAFDPLPTIFAFVGSRAFGAILATTFAVAADRISATIILPSVVLPVDTRWATWLRRRCSLGQCHCRCRCLRHGIYSVAG